MSADQETRIGSPRVCAVLGVELDRSAGVPEEATAQHEDLVGLGGGLRGAGREEVGLESSGPGAIGAVELPGDIHGALDEVAFEVVAGLERGGPGVEPGAEGAAVLAGEEREAGAHAVLECIES